ncbi:hypothetical protein BJ123_13012 [Rhodopseudomonas thermotolerans]|uniref:Uncharacterized protein n=2 Tax=Rhodopseudomonas TaxID=1073 RepID=A0A336JTM3_9BRAD|nr:MULTISPECIES: hypothetical protein [Rhodopseudomonas]RED25779.1 hypothetical protein BJ125_13012 [Rhodopseudomonas pentothenatexigens]REF90408.1 hypothetical protein BJ123_13012 [Rhodopseudomonas thermotolerans]SSW93107.1 hypothetical protein SAMN05892882_13012 [Rhodopseudomonas pentothenatexigens]
MSNMFIIGKRLVPVDHVALVEEYQPGSASRLQTSRDFKARVVLINRDSILTEETVEAFAADKGFSVIPGEGIAINPRVHFRVETFEPAEGFTPTKPYRSRLLWRDQDGNDQSKLLLAEPEIVLDITLKPVADPAPDQSAERKAPRAAGRRKSVRNGPTATV